MKLFKKKPAKIARSFRRQSLPPIPLTVDALIERLTTDGQEVPNRELLTDLIDRVWLVFFV